MEKNRSKVSKVLEELKKANLTIIAKGEYEYYYARQISNTRFGAMPDFIVYCKKVEDVQACINVSRDNDYPFRVRSGGHQHEGMSSGNQVMIIDLSFIYDKKIEFTKANEAWIPVGKQLQEVYNELEIRGQVIPGGGCQSVNVGGLTQGGGWGTSIRKYGLTCDNILEAEVVLASGEKVIANNDNEKELFTSLQGGGGGNFGVVTRFKFKLSSLGKFKTSFAIRWTDETKVKKVIKRWIDMHQLDFIKPNKIRLDENLSCTASLSVNSAGDENNKCKAAVYASVGGMYYGTKEELLKVLKKHFDIDKNSLLPLNEKDEPIFEKEKYCLENTPKNYFVRLNEVEVKVNIIEKSDVKEVLLGSDANESIKGRVTLEHQFISEFMNSTVTATFSDREKSILKRSTIIKKEHKVICDRGYNVIPNAPGITCDQPHPHKITSGFPKQDIDHHALVDKIYEALLATKYYVDVNKYMVWHCFGGAVLDKINHGIFPFREKPYLLQLQCWWDDSGRLKDDIGRSKEYVNWVNDFRKKHVAEHTDGAFINFVDKNIVSNNPDLDNIDERLDLLKHYYGKNLDQLRKNKRKYDAKNLFNFQMSIPLSKE